jgi:inosine-uridine nucleoside N-ribohydrolase
VLVHLDTDFAGDTGDAAALAFLLGRDDVELVGVTTTADPDGTRAGYVETFLALAGRHGIPCVAGAGASLAGAPMGDLPDHTRTGARSRRPRARRRPRPRSS